MIKNQDFHYNLSIDYHRSRKGSIRPLQPALKNKFQNRDISNYLDHKLNPEYNFGSFIEGQCNMMARSAAIVAGNNPGGNQLNPLIIYGDSGLGKTHLAQATGILIKEKFPDKNVFYVTGSKFQSEFDESFKNNKMNDFFHFYQMIDVLILDDVHEFSDNEITLASFLHLFNHPNRNGKQLILTCNKVSMEFQMIEKRLFSQFKYALRVELHIADYQTRLNILKKKTNDYQIKLSDEIFEFLAVILLINIRELDLVLNSVSQQSKINKTEITFEMVSQVVEEIRGVSRSEITIEYIQKIVCDYYGIPLELIYRGIRRKEIVQARQVSMFFSRYLTENSLASIGLHTGAKNHGTVVHACKAVYKHIKENVQFSNQIREIEKKIKFSLF